MRSLRLFGAVFVAMGFASTASAISCFEINDADSLTGLAQTCATPTSIIGNTGVSPDIADMYAFYIYHPSQFSATTVGGAGFNTQLFLFDSTGMGVLANDDTAMSQPRSTISAGLLLGPPGLYYLAITAFNRDPVSAGGVIFPGGPVGVVGPTGPGGASPVIGYTAAPNGPGGGYSIALTGTVPEPGTVIVLGLGLVGIAAWRRRRSG